MSNDISKLNQFHPIQSYTNSIYNKQYIGFIYNKLGIIDYNDYIFSITNDTNYLNFILSHNQVTHDKITSVVFSDINQQKWAIIS